MPYYYQMTTSAEKLSQSLSALQLVKDKGLVAIPSKQLSRTHRQRLLKRGFIREVMKGWYIASLPVDANEKGISWYATYWRFCSDYLHRRFGDNWCLSPEQSLRLQIGNLQIPKQLSVRSPKGGNKPTSLLYNTSIMELRLAFPPPQEIDIKENMRIMSLPSALIACPPISFTNDPETMRTALAMLSDAFELLPSLIAGSHSKIASRLIGALRHLGRDSIADNILMAMQAEDYVIREHNPFDHDFSDALNKQAVYPYVNRKPVKKKDKSLSQLSLHF